jgi:HAMP domain-containing protein
MMSLLSPGEVVLLALCVALALIALAATYRYRRRITAACEPLTSVLRARELRKLDAHLNQVAADELGRLARDVVHYVAGDVGHVVVISDHPRHSIALGLSDGHLLTISGVTRVTRSLLLHHAANDKLRPARVERDGYSYRLLLRGESGHEMRIHTPMVSLTH